MSDKKQFVKKDGAQEETKGEDSNMRGKKQQNRQKKPAGEESKEAPAQNRDRKNNNNRGREGNQNGERRQGGGPQKRRNEDQNSWAWKFHHAERPQFEAVKIDENTVIPELPEKADRLKEPSKAALDKLLQDVDAQINKIRTETDLLHQKRKEINGSGKVSGQNITYKEALNTKIRALKEVQAVRKTLNAKMKAARDELTSLDEEKRNLLKLMHKDYHNVEEVLEAIKRLEYEQKTTSFTSARQENAMIKETEQLKASVPKAKRLTELKGRQSELNATKKKIWDELSVVRTDHSKLEAEIDEIRKQMTEVREGQTDIKEQADKVTEEINANKEQVSALYSKKDTAREEYWHKRYDHDIQKAQIAHIEWLTNQKARYLDREGHRAEALAQKEADLQNLPHPYLEEIGVCDHLIAFCNQLKVRAGLVTSDEATAKNMQQSILTENNRADLAKKVQNKQIEVAMNKHEREASQMIQIGGGKNKKGKKQKKVEYEDTFNFDYIVIRKFSIISASLPEAPEDLDEKIKEIEAKRQWYTENGATKLEEMREQFKKEIESEDAEEQKLIEEEEQVQAERFSTGRRGGRGGFRGREGDSGARGRGGRGRGARPSRFRVKDEFEGSDDETPAQITQKPKKQKQKAEDLVLTEENYPTLA